MNTTKEDFMKELNEDSEFIRADEQYKELMYLNFLLDQLHDKDISTFLSTSEENVVISSTYKCFDYQWGHEQGHEDEDAFILYSPDNNENRTFISSKKITSVELLESDILPCVITVNLNNGLQIEILEL